MPTPPSSAMRDRLLAAAVQILSDEGGAALTVRRVAQAAGCSTIGVYTHFEGKAGLLDAVVQDAYEDFDAALSRADRFDDGIERMVTAGRAYRRWALSNPTRYRVMFASLVPDFTPGPATLARGDASLEAHRARVRYCMQGGDFAHADVDVVAHHMWATLHGHCMLHILTGVQVGNKSEWTDFDLCLQWLLAGLRPAVPARRRSTAAHKAAPSPASR